jgi:hypothetical protein
VVNECKITDKIPNNINQNTKTIEDTTSEANPLSESSLKLLQKNDKNNVNNNNINDNNINDNNIDNLRLKRINHFETNNNIEVFNQINTDSDESYSEVNNASTEKNIKKRINKIKISKLQLINNNLENETNDFFEANKPEMISESESSKNELEKNNDIIETDINASLVPMAEAEKNIKKKGRKPKINKS